MLRPGATPDGQQFSMIDSEGLEAQITRLATLLEDPSLTPSYRQKIIRQIADLKAKLADRKAREEQQNKMQLRMRGPGQISPGGFASMAAMMSRRRG